MPENKVEMPTLSIAFNSRAKSNKQGDGWFNLLQLSNIVSLSHGKILIFVCVAIDFYKIISKYSILVYDLLIPYEFIACKNYSMSDIPTHKFAFSHSHSH